MKVLITGGAGFIGTNLADHLLTEGHDVLILDNLSRTGVSHNLDWLQYKHGQAHLQVMIEDIRDADAVYDAVAEVDQVYHLAAQVAVTTSRANPIEDFDINVKGTLNLLEALRAMQHPPSLVFTSTSKVYGVLDGELLEQRTRYMPADPEIAFHGYNEAHGLDFHSPYGCSKGAADQYVLDYARTYGLPAMVFRLSTTYGAHQFGTADQGWVAHCLINALRGIPITICGDGKQVRDALYIDDLLAALRIGHLCIDRLSGQAFNLGGGIGNATSLIELLNLITDITGKVPELQFSGWRPDDPRYFVSDTRKFALETGWKPLTNLPTGLQHLYHWLIAERGLVERIDL